MWGIFPELEVEKKQTHHLRNQLPNHNSFENNSFQNDAIMERRRAKAMKVCISFTNRVLLLTNTFLIAT